MVGEMAGSLFLTLALAVLRLRLLLRQQLVGHPSQAPAESQKPSGFHCKGRYHDEGQTFFTDAPLRPLVAHSFCRTAQPAIVANLRGTRVIALLSHLLPRKKRGRESIDNALSIDSRPLSFPRRTPPPFPP